MSGNGWKMSMENMKTTAPCGVSPGFALRMTCDVIVRDGVNPDNRGSGIGVLSVRSCKLFICYSEGKFF